MAMLRSSLFYLITKENFLNRSFVYTSQKLPIAFIAIQCTSKSIKWCAHTLAMLILGFASFLPFYCSLTSSNEMYELLKFITLLN